MICNMNINNEQNLKGGISNFEEKLIAKILLSQGFMFLDILILLDIQKKCAQGIVRCSARILKNILKWH